MQGVLVAVVPVLIAGFALLMDRFESRILSPTTGGPRGGEGAAEALAPAAAPGAGTESAAPSPEGEPAE